MDNYTNGWIVGSLAAGVYLLVGILAGSGLAGCGQEVESPDPQLEEGEVGATDRENAAVYPGFACNEQGSTWVELKGSNFTPLVLGAMEDGEAQFSWPSVTLTRKKDVQGNEVSDGRSVTIEETDWEIVQEGSGGSGGSSDATSTMMQGLHDGGDVAHDGGTSDTTDVSGDVPQDGDSGSVSDTSDGGTTDGGGTADAGDAVTEDGGGTRDTTGGDAGGDDAGGARDTGSGEDTGSGDDAGAQDDAGTTDDAGDDESDRNQHVVWLSDAKVRFEVTPEMELPPGMYDVTINTSREPDGEKKTATRSEAFGVVPRPSIDAVGRGSISDGELQSVASRPYCLAQGERTVTVRGQFLMRRQRSEGEDQKVAIRLREGEGEQTYRPDAMGGCEEPGGPFGPYELCDWARITVGEGDVPNGRHDVTAENFAPAACQSKPEEDGSSFRVVGEPSIHSVSPDPICPAGVSYTGGEDAYQRLTVEGEGFLRVAQSDGTPLLPTATVGAYEVEDLELANCSAVSGNVPEGTESCTTVHLSVPSGQAALEQEEPITRRAVEITNPATASCRTLEEKQYTSIRPPVVDQVSPQPIVEPSASDAEGVASPDNGRQVTLTGRRFAVVDGAMPEVTIGSTTYTPQAAENCEELKGPGQRRVNLCRRLQLEVRPGELALPDGESQTTFDIQVRNPEPVQCTSRSGQESLQVIDSPEIGGVSPAPVCTTDDDVQLTIRSASTDDPDMLRIDGQRPRIGIGMQMFEADSVGNCSGLRDAPQDVDVCETATVTVPESMELMTRELPVSLFNPEPTGGFAVETGVSLTVVDQPSISQIKPRLVCPGSGSAQTVELIGRNFLSITPMGASSPELPTVSIANPDADATVQSVAGCETVEGTTADVQSCNRVRFTVDNPASRDEVADVTVTNPTTGSSDADCQAEETARLRIDSSPELLSVSTIDTSCSDPDRRRISVQGNRILRSGRSLPEVTISNDNTSASSSDSGTAVQVLTGNSCTPVFSDPRASDTLQYCEEIIVEADANLLQDNPSLELANPAPSSCSATVDSADIDTCP